MTHADALDNYFDGLLGSTIVQATAPPSKLAVVPAPPLKGGALPAPAPSPTPAPAPAASRSPQERGPPADHRAPFVSEPQDGLSAVVTPDPTGASATSEPIRWLGLSLAGQTYALAVKNVQEVVPVPDIAPVVGADADTVGVMNLRGQIVQVISLRRRMGLDAAAIASPTRIIVLEHDGIVLGLLVDSVTEVFSAGADEFRQSGLVHAALPSDWFRGLLRRGADLVVALDAARLVTH